MNIFILEKDDESRDDPYKETSFVIMNEEEKEATELYITEWEVIL